MLSLDSSSQGLSLSPEELASLVVERDKKEFQTEFGEMESSFEVSPPNWEKKKKKYTALEEKIRSESVSIPSWPVAGPLNYGMTLEKMKEVITNKFMEMANSGHLISEKQLGTYIRESFYPPDKKGGDNLTRIWGAEFLVSNLQHEKAINAPEHFLIIEDPSLEIEIQVWHGPYPYLSIVKKNGYVLSKKIEGEPKALEYRCSTDLAKLKYKDFGDIGNVIKDSKGTGWVVDTELKSFDPPKLSRESASMQNYARKRFEVLAKEEFFSLFQTFKISVSGFFSQ